MSFLKKLVLFIPKNTSVVIKRIRWYFTGVVKTSGVELLIEKNEISSKILSRMFKNKYEVAELALLEKMVEEDDVVLEIGSGIGFIGSIIGKMSKNRPKKIFLFEANPSLIKIIRRNLELNSSVPFEINNRILTSEDDEVKTFYVSEHFYSSSLIKQKEFQKEVNVQTENLISFAVDNRINFIISDIEGGEYELFSKALLPDCVKKVMLELHPEKCDDHIDLSKVFMKQGFTVKQISNQLIANR